MSFSLDEIRQFKVQATFDAPYAERIGFGLAIRLLDIRQTRGEDRDVLREINVLEGVETRSVTKAAEQFKRPPLHPLWHKHYSAPRHLTRNVGVRWGIENGGNLDLTAMIEKVAEEHGDQPDIWQKKVAYDFWLGGLQDRTSAGRMTGDWIIFAQHDGQNYYLDLASHEEARDDPDRLLAKLRGSSAWEFPFVFSQ